MAPGESPVRSEQALSDVVLAPGDSQILPNVGAANVAVSGDAGDLLRIDATGTNWLPVLDTYEFADAESMTWSSVSDVQRNGTTLSFSLRLPRPYAQMRFHHDDADATRGDLTVSVRRLESGASLMQTFEGSPCEHAHSWAPADALTKLGGATALELASARVLRRRQSCGTRCNPWVFDSLSTYNGNDVWWVNGGAYGALAGSVVLHLRRDAGGRPVVDVDATADATTPSWRCSLDTQRCTVQYLMYLPFKRNMLDVNGERVLRVGDELEAQVRSGCLYLKLTGGNTIHSYNSLNPNPYDRGELVITGTF